MPVRRPTFFSRPLPGLDASDKHRRRVTLLLLFGSSIVIALGLGWGTYYLLKAKWVLLAMDAALASVGMAALACTLTNRTRLAALLSAHALLVVISLICYFDVPDVGVPRSAHMHLLTLAAASFLLFRRENTYLRVVLPLICFAVALFYAGSDFGVTNPDYIPPPEAREISVWINNASCFFTIAMVLVIMQADVTARNAIEDDMRTALAQGHFTLHYQPQVREDGHGHGQVIGAEALLRWDHPQRGMILPGKFISLAEETGLIVPIGDWVLRKACTQLAEWAGHPRTAALTLSVNVSASQFRQPDFVPQVLDIVQRSGIDPSRLKLELTESLLVKDMDEVVRKMAELRARGLALSLDDFGTGYSSLNYLKRLPIDQLKIDQSFVRDLLNDPNDMAIVRTLVSLGQSLNLMLIAEGVETAEQLAWLRENGCPAYQGFLFSKPLPIDLFEKLVATPPSMPAAQGPRPRPAAGKPVVV